MEHRRQKGSHDKLKARLDLRKRKNVQNAAVIPSKSSSMRKRMHHSNSETYEGDFQSIGSDKSIPYRHHVHTSLNRIRHDKGLSKATRSNRSAASSVIKSSNGRNTDKAATLIKHQGSNSNLHKSSKTRIAQSVVESPISSPRSSLNSDIFSSSDIQNPKHSLDTHHSMRLLDSQSEESVLTSNEPLKPDDRSRRNILMHSRKMGKRPPENLNTFQSDAKGNLSLDGGGHASKRQKSLNTSKIIANSNMTFKMLPESTVEADVRSQRRDNRRKLDASHAANSLPKQTVQHTHPNIREHCSSHKVFTKTVAVKGNRLGSASFHDPLSGIAKSVHLPEKDKSISSRSIRSPLRMAHQFSYEPPSSEILSASGCYITDTSKPMSRDPVDASTSPTHPFQITERESKSHAIDKSVMTDTHQTSAYIHTFPLSNKNSVNTGGIRTLNVSATSLNSTSSQVYGINPNFVSNRVQNENYQSSAHLSNSLYEEDLVTSSSRLHQEVPKTFNFTFASPIQTNAIFSMNRDETLAQRLGLVNDEPTAHEEKFRTPIMKEASEALHSTNLTSIRSLTRGDVKPTENHNYQDLNTIAPPFNKDSVERILKIHREERSKLLCIPFRLNPETTHANSMQIPDAISNISTSEMDSVFDIPANDAASSSNIIQSLQGWVEERQAHELNRSAECKHLNFITRKEKVTQPHGFQRLSVPIGLLAKHNLPQVPKNIRIDTSSLDTVDVKCVMQRSAALVQLGRTFLDYIVQYLSQLPESGKFTEQRKNLLINILTALRDRIQMSFFEKILSKVLNVTNSSQMLKECERSIERPGYFTKVIVHKCWRAAFCEHVTYISRLFGHWAKCQDALQELGVDESDLTCLDKFYLEDEESKSKTITDSFTNIPNQHSIHQLSSMLKTSLNDLLDLKVFENFKMDQFTENLKRKLMEQRFQTCNTYRQRLQSLQRRIFRSINQAMILLDGVLFIKHQVKQFSQILADNAFVNISDRQLLSMMQADNVQPQLQMEIADKTASRDSVPDVPDFMGGYDWSVYVRKRPYLEDDSISRQSLHSLLESENEEILSIGHIDRKLSDAKSQKNLSVEPELQDQIFPYSNLELKNSTRLVSKDEVKKAVLNNFNLQQTTSKTRDRTFVIQHKDDHGNNDTHLQTLKKTTSELQPLHCTPKRHKIQPI